MSISPFRNKALIHKVFTFASEFLKIRIIETKEYFEKEMFFFESLRLPLDKISCTRQFESKLSLRSFAKSLAKGSSTSNQAFLLRRKDVTALRCSEPLRSKVGGASKPSPCFAGWDRLGKGGGEGA